MGTKPAGDDVLAKLKNLYQTSDTSPSRSYYMSQNDFIFSNQFIGSDTKELDTNGVQPIIFNEFQPDASFWSSELGTTFRCSFKNG